MTTQTKKKGLPRVNIPEYVLKYLETHDTIKPADIENDIDQSRPTISRALKKMGEQGILERVHSGKGHPAWQLAKKSRWKGVRLSDLEYEGMLRTIAHLSRIKASPLEISQAIRVDKPTVQICLRILYELDVISIYSTQINYYVYQLTEDGLRLAKVIQQIEDV